MRNPAYAIPLALALAACDKPQPNVAVPPPAAPVQATVAAKPAEPPPAPQPSPSAQLAAKIKSALRGARNLEAQGVDVTVAEGVVTLHGTVPAAEESRNIADFVARMDGVRSVVNNLVVIRGS
jgi:osmotically-inducible protein OsmY